jgi:Domain of unknown function (DUF4157)
MSAPLPSFASPTASVKATSGQSRILQRQCKCGTHTIAGGECQECAKKMSWFQRKLAIGASDDPLELEADRVADQVLAEPAHSTVNTTTPRIQRLTGQAMKEAEAAPASVERVLAGPGRPLDPALRQDMGHRFGHDFSRVKVHTGGTAERSAQDVNALAYTVGEHVVFGAGRFSPGAHEGRRLLAHELAHTIQQGATAPSSQATFGRSGAGRVPQSLLQRTTDPYQDSTIPELRRRAVTDPAAADALRERFRAMSDVDLERYARNDPMAQSIYADRKIAPRDAQGQGRFSQTDIQARLTQDIATARADLQARTGITRRESTADTRTEGGTMASARTDIPGFDKSPFIGRSPQAGGQVNPNSNFAPQTDPKLLPQTHGHAEQDIADQLETALKSVPREQLRGRRVWILVEQEPCSTCAQGAVDQTQAPGVLRKLSAAYPEVTFEVKSSGSSALLNLKAAPLSGAPTPPSVAEEGSLKSGPKLPPESLNAPPAELTAPKTKLPEAGPDSTGTGRKIPALGEGDLLEGRPRPSVGSGRMGRLGAAAMEGAAVTSLEIVLLITQLVIELTVVPMLEKMQQDIEKWRQELEEEQRKRIQQKIQKEYDDYQSKLINRQLRYCYLQKIRAAEAAGKKLYVKTDLKVRLKDTSDRLEPLSKTLPDSAFDIDFDRIDLGNVSLVEKPVEPSATELKCVESCGLRDEGPSLPLGGDPTWERTITFTFEAPSSAALLKEFPEKPGETPEGQCGCFIATACYGSFLAPEVETLRRFRDRRLIRHRLGRRFIQIYYSLSPPVACWLEHHHACRAVVRSSVVAPIAHAVSRMGWDE